MAKKARVFGHIDGVPVGAMFPDRKKLSQAGVHRATQAGITGGADGSESIALKCKPWARSRPALLHLFL
jgi:putative restriction endonuclease